MNNSLKIIFDKKLVPGGSNQIYWNLYFKSYDNILSIPYEIDRNPDYYKEIYLLFIDSLNTFFSPKIIIDELPYWLITGVSSKQAAFTSPFEIENSIKFFFLEKHLSSNKYSKISILGSLDIRIYKVIKSIKLENGLHITFNINLLNKIRYRKYFSPLKLFINIMFQSFLNLFKKHQPLNKFKKVLVSYSSSSRYINYWSELNKQLSDDTTLSILIDSNSSLSRYKQKSKFENIFLFNHFNFMFLIKKYFKILSYYSFVINSKEFNYKNQINLKYLFADIIFKDFVGSNAFFNSIVMSTSKRLSKSLIDEITILYPRENQSWEKILLFYLNKRSKSIGYLHAGFKFWDLTNYHNDFNLLQSNNMIPDHFAIHSQKLIEILSKSKFFNQENFSLVESLRLQNFSGVQKSTSPKSLIVLLDYDIKSSVNQIKLVLDFMKKYSFSNVKFKPHPTNYNRIRQLFKDIIFVNANIIDIVENYSHFFCSNNTTLSLELINSGFNTAIMSSGKNLDMNPLKIYNIKTGIICDEDDLNQFLNTDANIHRNNLIYFDDKLSYWRNLLN